MAVVAIAVTACGSSAPPLATAVDDVATDSLSVAYPEAIAAIETLQVAVTETCADPTTESLRVARDRWITAQEAWKTTQAGWFGPTTMDRHDSRIGWQPADPEGIEATIASDETIDPAFVIDALPTTQQGLAAIEYLLFGSTPLDERRCEYTTAVAVATADESSDMGVSWFTTWDGGAAYLDRLTGTGEPAMSPRDALGDAVAAMSELLAVVTLRQLGRELGITSPAPDPGAYPEGLARYGLGALRAQVAGLSAAYGMEPSSIAGAVASRSPDVDAAIRGDLDAAHDLIATVVAEQGGTSMAVAVDQQRNELEELYGILANLRRTLDTDVVALLDLTLGFSDSDGDSG